MSKIRHTSYSTFYPTFPGLSKSLDTNEFTLLFVCLFVFNVLKLYFNITILTEIHIFVNRMQFNLSYTIWTKKLGTWFALKKKEKGFAVWFIFYLLQMYIKDLPSNAAEVNSMNLEKLNFGLSLKNNMYCTVKINKVGATKHCCNVSMPVHKVQ